MGYKCLISKKDFDTIFKMLDKSYSTCGDYMDDPSIVHVHFIASLLNDAGVKYNHINRYPLKKKLFVQIADGYVFNYTRSQYDEFIDIFIKQEVEDHEKYVEFNKQLFSVICLILLIALLNSIYFYFT